MDDPAHKLTLTAWCGSCSHCGDPPADVPGLHGGHHTGRAWGGPTSCPEQDWHWSQHRAAVALPPFTDGDPPLPEAVAPIQLSNCPKYSA